MQLKQTLTVVTINRAGTNVNLQDAVLHLIAADDHIKLALSPAITNIADLLTKMHSLIPSSHSLPKVVTHTV